MASVANSTRGSEITSFPGGCFLSTLGRCLRFPLLGRPKARECLFIRILWSGLGLHCKPKSRDLRTQDSVISPRRSWLEIFSLLSRRLSDSELANELNVSIKTMETYQMHIKEKLALHSTAESRQKTREWLARFALNRIREDPEAA